MPEGGRLSSALQVHMMKKLWEAKEGSLAVNRGFGVVEQRIYC